MSYHISITGDPKLCTAKIKACPRGGESGIDNHFDSIEDARKHVESEMADGILISHKKEILIPAEITLSSNLGTFDVDNGDLSNSNARLALSSGLCGDLARAINRISGADIYFVTHQTSETEESLQKKFLEEPRSVFDACHVVVQSQSDPDCFIDSYGHKTREEIDEFYDGVIVVKGSKEMVERFSGDTHEELNEFALAALELDRNRVSFDYEDFEAEENDDWGDDEDFED
jgi:hypothetical protein